MRRAVWLIALGVAAAFLGVGVARAAGTGTTTAASQTSAAQTSAAQTSAAQTSAAQTSAAQTSAAQTSAAQTSAAQTGAAQTGTTSSTTTDTTTTDTTTTDTTTTETTTTVTTTTSTTGTTPTQSFAPLASSSLPAGCLGAGALAVVRPSRQVVAYGAPASTLGPSAYDTARGSVLSFGSSVAHGATCRSATVELGSVSLFAGAVTARTVRATHGTGTVFGLEINGVPVSIKTRETVQVDRWGMVSIGATVGRLRAPLVVRLVRAHDSLPSGTVLAVGFAASATTRHKPARGERNGSKAAHSGKRPGHVHSLHRVRSPAFPASTDPFLLGYLLAPAEQRNPVVSTAIKYLGVPYTWGGASPRRGFDCSGLVKYVFAKLGVSLPHFAAAQFYSPDAVPVAADKLQAGDLVFFVGSDGTRKMPGHVGIYIGDGYLIDAPHTGAYVEIDNLDERWFAENYVGARRIVFGNDYVDVRRRAPESDPRPVLDASRNAASVPTLTWLSPFALLEQTDRSALPEIAAVRAAQHEPAPQPSVMWASASFGGVLLSSFAVAFRYRRRRRKPQDAESA